MMATQVRDNVFSLLLDTGTPYAANAFNSKNSLSREECLSEV